MHVAIVYALEVSAESKTLHLAEEIRVVGECVLERAVLLASLAHENAPPFLQYLRFNDSGIVSKIRRVNLTFEDSLHRLAVAVGA
jgi:hypothetical protein